nr:MAG TPA: Preprotein translocase subunit SecE, Preprotein, archaeal, ribosomal, 50S, protein.0A [Caudoviricetes sp.]
MGKVFILGMIVGILGVLGYLIYVILSAYGVV